MRRSLVTIIAALCLTSGAFAKQDRAPSRTQGAPIAQRGVQANTIEEAQTMGCEIRDIWMATGGLLFNCNPSEGENVLAAFDGGNRPGGISAAMSLLIQMKSTNRLVRIRYQNDADNPICRQVDAGLSYDCVRVISFGGF